MLDVRFLAACQPYRYLGEIAILKANRAYLLVLAPAVIAFIALYTAQTYTNFLAGNSQFDLAVYEQSFWNALGSPPFFNSLEGGSHFGRHFSPVFYLILPFYLLHRDPLTLLAAQSTAIGLGAFAVYGVASQRLDGAFALVISLAYLLNPAVEDVDVKNDFHEFSFALPALLLLVYLLSHRSTPLYVAGLLLALSTREEAALTTLLLGIYLILVNRQVARGLMTVGMSAGWFLLVVIWLMPLFNPNGTFPPPYGYEYLGTTFPSIIIGIAEKPGLVLHQIIQPPKLDYVFWLLEPLGFLALLSPEVLLIALIALLEILASTRPSTFEIFERYSAPIVPFVFIAAVIGCERLVKLMSPAKKKFVSAALVALIFLSTGYAQLMLHKLPSGLRVAPDERTQAILAVAETILAGASVAVDDHHWLAHLANRRYLYPLSASAPETDFVMFDPAHAPLTNVPLTELRAVETRLLHDPSYQALVCYDGFILLGKRGQPGLRAYPGC